ncbi:alkaline phosphatase [Bacillus cereus]|uniref:alkaline phosphatase n=1 Tax=Bacillus nitratireducens TaxID=2026193 RepID=UPI000BEC9B71|nr:alkaline phosphatase [Bacillus nitratireducens]PEE14829.1 alkaline phosphatase [Bacillus cereus]MED0906512.1 alkaline phosphatase [Bacillus nitratireducens]PES82451.1 alkaline phosphatase [Bacillus cereus]PET08532.1 alkaline phosphatase [Bacillus cereus]PFF27137.1 alkaline phosphatase [Bacillus cereus]
MFKRVATIVLGVSILFTGVYTNADRTASAKSEYKSKKVKNVIFLIPDGFSASYASSYYWYKGSSSLMDQILVGMVRTHSANKQVTDSAAAATAMATGVKTNNRMISVSPSGETLPTILEASKKAGKSTGLVSTTTITDATPASFAAHVGTRADEVDIAPQLIENNVDVLFGGGKNFFLPVAEGGKQPTRNLIVEAKKKGYQLIEKGEQLATTKATGKILGLFADESMAPELDRMNTNQPSLEDMTTMAISTLEKDRDGFFLMVEGSQIDVAGHEHDAARAMKEVESFEKAVKVSLDYAKNNGETLILIAGDHDTGGMTIGRDGIFTTQVEILRKVSASGTFMTQQVNSEKSNIKEVLKQYASIDLTDQEVTQIKEAADMTLAINDVISERAVIGWTTVGHTGVNNPVYAYGPSSDGFRGLHDNIDFPKLIAKAMGINF